MLSTFTLSNGIRVVTYTMSSLRSVHLQLSVKGGSLVENSKNNGVAHYMEHMLVQGIPSLPNVLQMSTFIEGIAGKYNAYTSQLAVSYSMTVPFSATEDAIKIASEVFFEPLFPEESLEKERRAVINEIKQDMDSRWFKFNEFFKDIRFTKKSSLKRKISGTIDIVEKLTKEDLLSYWHEYFSPSNTYLFLIGNLNQAEIGNQLEMHFGKHQSVHKFSGYPKMSNSNDLGKRRVAIRNDPELQVNYLDLVFPSLSLKDDLLLRVKQNIALIILGRLRTSRLFQLLRYEKGLVYNVSANHSLWPDTGYAFITSEVASEHLTEVIELSTRELTSFREKGPLEDELTFTKNYLANSWLMAFDNPSSIAEWISDDFLWKEKILLPEDYIKLLADISVKDLVEVMQNHWDMKKLQLIIQGPIENTPKNIKKFNSLISQLR